ncbi:MAG: transposase [Psychromonas sp.]|nr:transposase [Psychromonas sp.]
MEGILYRLRVGCPCRDLPESFGLWNTIYRRYLLWSRIRILMWLFKSLCIDTDTQWEFIDGSYYPKTRGIIT